MNRVHDCFLRRPAEVRQFLAGRREVVEAYEACWHGRGIFGERISVRLDRHPQSCTIVGTIFEMDDDARWQPARITRRELIDSEWSDVRGWIEAGFWLQPWWEVRGAPFMDGDEWIMTGFDRGVCRRVRRTMGDVVDHVGTGVYELGWKLAKMAELRR